MRCVLIAVVISLAPPAGAGAGCQETLAHIKDPPRNIVDPAADSLPIDTKAWIAGPGTRIEGIDERPATFKRYSGNVLIFDGVPFTDGDSGSPVFSDAGHLI